MSSTTRSGPKPKASGLSQKARWSAKLLFVGREGEEGQESTGQHRRQSPPPVAAQHRPPFTTKPKPARLGSSRVRTELLGMGGHAGSQQQRTGDRCQ